RASVSAIENRPNGAPCHGSPDARKSRKTSTLEDERNDNLTRGKRAVPSPLVIGQSAIALLSGRAKIDVLGPPARRSRAREPRSVALHQFLMPRMTHEGLKGGLALPYRDRKDRPP